MGTNELARTPGNDAKALDAKTQAKVVESLVIRGDMSGLNPLDRARHYVHMCESLGLNPASQPFAYLRLNGKEVLYATRGATDQLAAMARLTRKIIDGPKIVDLAGTKLVIAVCEATHPNGRVETATATVPLIDPVNVLMKCETKAKRRATLSILGLGVLDEMELDTIPVNAQEPGGGVDLSLLDASAKESDAIQAEATAPPAASVALDEFYARVAEIEMPGEAVAVWLKHRAGLHELAEAARREAWDALVKCIARVGKMKQDGAKAWLKKAVAEEDARAALAGQGSSHAAA
jgi:hypothetical protein